WLGMMGRPYKFKTPGPRRAPRPPWIGLPATRGSTSTIGLLAFRARVGRRHVFRRARCALVPSCSKKLLSFQRHYVQLDPIGTGNSSFALRPLGIRSHRFHEFSRVTEGAPRLV